MKTARLVLKKTILQGLKQHNLRMTMLVLQKKNFAWSKTTETSYDNINFTKKKLQGGKPEFV